MVNDSVRVQVPCVMVNDSVRVQVPCVMVNDSVRVQVPCVMVNDSVRVQVPCARHGVALGCNVRVKAYFFLCMLRDILALPGPNSTITIVLELGL